MASPFSVFRKNQKVLMAIACLLAIIAFVFLPMLGQNIGSRSGGASNPVVVKTSQFGDLKETNIHDLLLMHRRVLAVLADIGQLAGIPPAMADQIVKNTFLPPTEENVVDNWLLAKHARQMGMVVSDDAVNAFLKLWTRDTVKPADLTAALKRSGFTVLQFFDLMRDELMARQLRKMFIASLEGITPAERWEYFSRVKKMATIEAAAIDVAAFVNRVDDPNDEELKAFFEEHKNQHAFPGSPEAGFREPQKVALQWFKADQEKYLAAVTDAEIKERYEKNKDVYEQLEKRLEESKAKEVKKEGSSTKDAKDVPEKKEIEKTDAKKTEETKKSTESQDGEKSEKKENTKDSSAVDRPSPFKLTALLQEEKSAEKAVTKIGTPEAKAVEEPKTPATQEKPAEEKHGMAETTKNRIRREIAQEKMMKVFDGLREKMDQYRNERNKYEVTLIQEQNKKEEERKIPSPPTPFDFEQLAKQSGLSTGQTDLMSQWQAQSTAIGSSFAGGRVPVSSFAFQSLSKFRPEISIDLLGNFYLFWKTEATKDRVPKFEDKGVREEALRAWKMIKARSLAVKEAESLANEARKIGKTLKEALADRPDMQVIMPPPFSWITFGNVPLGSAPQAARISDVTGVEYAGEEFMQTVFRLEPSQIGVAMNEPKTVAYVIQLNEFSPSHNVLWKEFEVDDFSKYAIVAQDDRQRIHQAWLDEIKTSAGMTWKRKPGQMMESGPGGEE